MPFLSIITVSYNAGKLIEPTIRSVIQQSCNDYEYIIIDGNSKDNTLEIINRYKEKISTIISEPDTGVYDAMNKGLRIATGDYVLFMNAGDEFIHNSILGSIKEKSSADVIYGETQIINKNRDILGSRTELTSRKLPHELKKRDFLKGQVVSHQSFIARRSLTQPYNLQYKCSADIDWMLQIISRSKIIINVGEPIAKYLQGGISDSKLIQCWKERFIILLKHFTFFEVILAHLNFAFRFLKFGQYRKSNS